MIGVKTTTAAALVVLLVGSIFAFSGYLEDNGGLDDENDEDLSVEMEIPKAESRETDFDDNRPEEDKELVWVQVRLKSLIDDDILIATGDFGLQLEMEAYIDIHQEKDMPYRLEEGEEE